MTGEGTSGADRATVIREMADQLAALVQESFRDRITDAARPGLCTVVEYLRRVAAETDDIDLTEADVDRMMAEGVPVQLVTEPPATYGPLLLRAADEEQPAETQWPGERCGLCPPGTRTRHLEDHMVQVHGARPAVGEQPDSLWEETAYLMVRMQIALIYEGVLHHPPTGADFGWLRADDVIIRKAVTAMWSKLDSRDRRILRRWGPGT